MASASAARICDGVGHNFVVFFLGRVSGVWCMESWKITVIVGGSYGVSDSERGMRGVCCWIRVFMRGGEGRRG